jgi:hypothetical protein
MRVAYCVVVDATINLKGLGGFISIHHGVTLSLSLSRPHSHTRLIDIFEHNGNTLTASDACRTNGVSLASALEFMNQVSRDARARRSQRMAQGNRAAVDVGLGRIEVQCLHDGKGLHSKSLVDLDNVNVVQRELGLGERLFDGRNGADAHDAGIHTDNTVADDTSKRSQVVALDSGFTGNHHGSGAIANARRITGSDDTSLLEYGRQFGQALDGGLGYKTRVSAQSTTLRVGCISCVRDSTYVVHARQS